jgi:hypothetical protein
MKLSEVPKDDANVMEGKTSFVQYAVDEHGNYVQAKSPGFQPANVALEQAWDEVNERVAEALELVEQGEKSPLYFFMHREIMDYSILAEYMGLMRWRVKRHMNPKVFAKLKPAILEKYARVFKLENISDLTNFNAEQWK